MPSPARNPFDHSPQLVFYEVTRACDLVCVHCRAYAQTCPHPRELRPAESLRLIDEISEFPATPTLVLTGGDPLKRADLCELVEHATRLRMQVAVTPSATPLVTRAALAELRDAGLARLAVSIDGACTATHDALRGVAGSFARTIEIIRDAAELGIPLQVNTAVGPHNRHELDALAELLSTLPIVMWSVFFLVPVGRAASMPRLDAAECEEVFAALWRQAQRRPFTIKTTEAPHYRRFVLQQREKRSGKTPTTIPPKVARAWSRYGINDGKGVVFVGHTGLIQPSGFLPIACGAFPHDRLVDVYQRSPIFRGLRDLDHLEGKCSECEFRKVCGGSRARAYAVTGNLFAADPDCAYVPRGGKRGASIDEQRALHEYRNEYN